MPSVNLGPAPIATFLDGVGNPLAGGLIYTYAAGTNTPQATYTDSTGTVSNTNPVVLDAAGRAEIWFLGAAYKIVVADSNNVQQYSVDNFQIGVFANSNIDFTGNVIFDGTATFNGPLIANNGGSLNGTFSGNPAFSGSPTFSGTIVANRFQATVATGTPPLIIASQTVVPNLNVENVNGVAFPVGGAIGTVPQISASNVITYVSPSTIVPASSYKVEHSDFNGATCTNTLVETTLFSFTLGAAEITAIGQALRITVGGAIGMAAVDASGCTVRVRMDGTEIIPQLPIPAQTEGPLGFTLSFLGQCVTTGAGGTFNTNASILSGFGVAQQLVDLYAVAQAFDTTSLHVFTITAQWAAGVTASETITGTQIFVERLG